MSKNQNAIQLAYRKGYRVDDDGRVRKCQVKKSRNDVRLVFNVGVGRGERYPVPVHRLQAFQKFGDAMFEPGIVVRHLDGDSTNNRPDNILIGTGSDNAMDRPAADRQAHASLAGSFTSPHDWEVIEHDHSVGKLGFKKLAAKYGVSLGALSSHFNRKDGWTPHKQYDFDWEKVKVHIAETRCSYKEAAAHFSCSERSIRRQLGPRSKTS